MCEVQSMGSRPDCKGWNPRFSLTRFANLGMLRNLFVSVSLLKWDSDSITQGWRKDSWVYQCKALGVLPGTE